MREQLPLQNHPLMQNNAFLPTKPLEGFANAIQQWLNLLIPGAFVWGNSRAGKTHAVRMLSTHLAEILGSNIPVEKLSMWEPSGNSNTERRFFEELLFAFDYPLSSGTGYTKMERAVDYILDAMKQVNEHRFLLLVDEAHQLSLPQYFHLANLHNRIAFKEKALIVVLVGQPELLETRKKFKEEKRAQLLGRFMAAEYEFRGLCGVTDFRYIVQAIDEKSEYPPNSGITYTRYFVPLAYAAGFRLTHYVDRIWKILEQRCKDEGIPDIKHLPMQPITALLRKLLFELSCRDVQGLELTTSLIQETIHEVAIGQIDNLIGQYLTYP